MKLEDVLKTPTRPKCRISITTEMRRDFESIQPGQISEVKVPSGQSFAVLRMEDLEHLLDQLNLTLSG